METMDAGATALQKRGRGAARAKKPPEPRRENAGTYAVQWNSSLNDFLAFLVALKMACSEMVASLTPRDEPRCKMKTFSESASRASYLGVEAENTAIWQRGQPKSVKC